MRGDREDVVVAGDTDEGRLEQRPRCRSKECRAASASSPRTWASRRPSGRSRTSHHRQREDELGLDPLPGPAVLGHEGRPQRLVAFDDGMEALCQGEDVEVAGEPYGAGHVVERIARLDLVDEPQALLGKGKWQTVPARHGCQRWRRGAGRPGSFDLRRELGQVRQVEHLLHGQLECRRFVDSRHELHDQEGMAAELKEIVGRADAVDHEEVGPDLGEPLFGRGARDDEGRPVVARRGRERQCLAVDLAAGQEGDLGELDEDPGPPCARAAFPRATGAAPRRPGRYRPRERRRPPAACRQGCPPASARRPAHPLVLAQARFDLFELDAEAADLDLEVDRPRNSTRPEALWRTRSPVL